MQRLLVATASAAALAGLVACGTTDRVEAIPGARVATMAEHQLEAMHSELATGTMTCPRLEFALDASVRCVRLAELSGGRQIRVLGTVTVTSTKDGGRLHVRLDDDVSEFGSPARSWRTTCGRAASGSSAPPPPTSAAPTWSAAPVRWCAARSSSSSAR